MAIKVLRKGDKAALPISAFPAENLTSGGWATGEVPEDGILVSSDNAKGILGVFITRTELEEAGIEFKIKNEAENS